MDLVVDLVQFKFIAIDTEKLNNCLSSIAGSLKQLPATRIEHLRWVAAARPNTVACLINAAQCLRNLQHTASLLQGRMSQNATRNIILVCFQYVGFALFPIDVCM